MKKTSQKKNVRLKFTSIKKPPIKGICFLISFFLKKVVEKILSFDEIKSKNKKKKILERAYNSKNLIFILFFIQMQVETHWKKKNYTQPVMKKITAWGKWKY